MKILRNQNFYLSGIAALLLSACAGQQQMGVGQSLAASWLNHECHRYIDGQEIWKLGKIALGDQAEPFKTQVCQCASQQAAKNMSTEQMIGLANEQKRPQILVEMIAPTVMVCYKEVKKLF